MHGVEVSLCSVINLDWQLTLLYIFFFLYLQIISARFPWVRFGTVHKKINLLETNVAWEHERYGMKHIPGFTLSHIENPKSELRGSILDTTWEKIYQIFLKFMSHYKTSARCRHWVNPNPKTSHKETHSFLHNKLKTDACLWSWICRKFEWQLPLCNVLHIYRLSFECAE